MNHFGFNYLTLVWLTVLFAIVANGAALYYSANRDFRRPLWVPLFTMQLLLLLPLEVGITLILAGIDDARPLRTFFRLLRWLLPAIFVSMGVGGVVEVIQIRVLRRAAFGQRKGG